MTAQLNPYRAIEVLGCDTAEGRFWRVQFYEQTQTDCTSLTTGWTAKLETAREWKRSLQGGAIPVGVSITRP